MCSKINYYTLFDINFYPRGLSLIESLHKNCTYKSITIFALDSNVFQKLKKFKKKLDINTIFIGDIFPNFEKELTNKRFYFFLTPFVSNYLISKIPKNEWIAYLDADLFFFSSIDPFIDDFNSYSIVITPQKLPIWRKIRESKTGKFNVGINFFKNDFNGVKCIKHWLNDSEKWIQKNGYDNYSDQIFLDDWPKKFKKSLYILDVETVNLCPWNIGNKTIKLSNNEILINDKKLILYHFSGLYQINECEWDTNMSENFIFYKRNIFFIYEKYIKNIYKYDETKIIKILNYPKSFLGVLKKYFKIISNDRIKVNRN